MLVFFLAFVWFWLFTGVFIVLAMLSNLDRADDFSWDLEEVFCFILSIVIWPFALLEYIEYKSEG